MHIPRYADALHPPAPQPPHPTLPLHITGPPLDFGEDRVRDATQTQGFSDVGRNWSERGIVKIVTKWKPNFLENGSYFLFK